MSRVRGGEEFTLTLEFCRDIPLTVFLECARFYSQLKTNGVSMGEAINHE